MKKLLEKLYGNLTEQKSELITINEFVDNSNIKKLEFGFNPFWFYSEPNTLFYYWWDMLEVETINFNLELFEKELLIYFNKRYNQTAKIANALYVGTTKRVNNY